MSSLDYSSMSNEQIVDRSAQIRAQSAISNQMVAEARAVEAPGSTERQPVADTVSGSDQAKQKESSGGCSSTFMKIIIVVVAVVVSYFYPAAIPQMAAMASQALMAPEEGEGNGHQSVSPHVRQMYQDIDQGYADDRAKANGETGNVSDGIDTQLASMGLTEEGDSFRNYLEQATGLGDDATWEELLLAYGSANAVDGVAPEAPEGQPTES